RVRFETGRGNCRADRRRGRRRHRAPGRGADGSRGERAMKESRDITVRDVMRHDVTMVDGRIDVMEAMRIMKRVGATSLIVKKRYPNDEYGMVLFSDIAKQ